MNIALDMMGGDYAPIEAVKGIKAFLSDAGNLLPQLTLIGNQESIQQLLSDYAIDTNRITVVNASQVIEMNEHPTRALREKKDEHAGHKH